ncbi:hypothetical protein VSX64_23905 [Aurantimonas sp. C2-6-R+9]|nr:MULTISPECIES: hypothetical protein [unclassified Aurantimonas]MEC5289949.1 hypothetical protein [Aurantimonas sp. C2-3-R2]MEC5383779.1 hypothetical protein [Aurantimonas sp. C2-6-R+9]
MPAVGADASVNGTTTADTGTETAATDGGQIVKDGSTMPLQDAAGTADTDVAMSAQDVKAQQEGEDTAAAAATGTQARATASSDPAFTAALEKARSALEQGNEAACLTAVEEARAIQG